MKTHKKILAGLFFPIFLAIFAFIFFQNVLAQTPVAPTVNLSNPRFTTGSTIVINVNGNSVTFFDSNTGDNTRNYRPQNINTSVFCGDGINNYGINISPSANLSANPVPATMNLGFRAGTNCLPIPQANINPSSIAIANPNALATTAFSWSNNNIVSTDGSMTLVPVPGSPTLGGTDTPRVYFSTSTTGLCATNGVIILSGPNAGRIYLLTDGVGSNINPSSPIYPYLNSFQRRECKILAERNITIAGTRGSTDPSDPSQPGGGTAGETCEAKWSSPLTWIACPLFAIATGLTDDLIKLFTDQLCFRTEDSANPTIECSTTDTSSIKPAWNAIKNIVSALLVIIMLIAVFAQAASIGPIDAYTLRKLLPRLVAAVILIQISFYLFSWVVNVVDDIGEGLFSLLQSIFASGTNKVNINNFYQLLDHAGVGIGTLAATNWLLLIGAIGFGIASLPALLLLVFTAVVAIFVGLAVLIFRKIIIIALLIISPVALLLWVLPNTERYWKMWWDNFLKVLLMFPIIVLIIEAGRIFAYVAGPTTSGFIALFIVMVGFFGPLFLLPKTFKWGGALMQMTGEGLTKAGATVAKPGQEYLGWRKGISRWNMARATRRGILERRAKTDFAKGLSIEGGKGVKGRLRGMKGGLNRARLAGVSTHEGDVRQKALQSAQAEVAKVFEEERGAADAELTQTILPNFDRNQQDLVREAIALGQTRRVTDLSGRTFDFDGAKHIETHGELHQRAALDRALIHGQMGVVDQYYTEAINSGDTKRAQKAEFFKNANAATLGEKLPHILKGMTIAANSGEDAISRMHGHEIESILAHFSTKAAEGDTEAAEALSGFLQRYQNARNNDTLRGNLDTRGITAVDAFIGAQRGDPAAIAEVNNINTGSLKKARAAAAGKDPNDPLVDREANRSRYQSPGTVPGKTTIPLITAPGAVGPVTPPPSGTLHVDH